MPPLKFFLSGQPHPFSVSSPHEQNRTRSHHSYSLRFLVRAGRIYSFTSCFSVCRFPPRRQKSETAENGSRSRPRQNDGKGGSKGSFAIYGGGLPREVSSLSFSGDGKFLAVGSTPGIVDLWDVEGKKKLFSLEGGTAVGLSLDGRTLAIDGKGIELYDVASRALKLRIPRTLKRPDNVVDNLAFNADGSLLVVTANGDEDTVFDVSSGRLVTTLQNTQHSQFSRDGSLLVGGNAKHLIV